jgi:phosphoribosylformylglycinamidine synthase
VAATNCLNFGNPEKPEIMAQLSATIDGIKEACEKLGTPITGGNVSLYNETKGVGIYPTPVIGIVGILEDVTKAVPASFQRIGDTILVIDYSFYPEAMRDFGSSEFAKEVLDELWGTPPWLEMDFAVDLQNALIKAAGLGLLRSCSSIDTGGLVVALAKAGLENGIGADVNCHRIGSFPEVFSLFAEGPSVLASCDPANLEAVRNLLDQYAHTYLVAGETTDERFRFSLAEKDYSRGPILIDTTIAELRHPWSKSLEATLHDEVTA